MHVALFPLVMNTVVAALFSVSYLALALLHRGYRAPLWLAASFGVLVLTPLAQLAQSYTGWTTVFAPIIYLSFAACLLLMIPALAELYRRPVSWGVVVLLCVVTCVSAGFVLHVRENTLLRVFFYQLPFTLAAAVCCWSVLRGSPRRMRDLLLAGMFALLSLHVPLKAILAVSLGTGPHQPDYLATPYAAISQIGTGILMVATALLLLVIAVLEVIRDAIEVAETDPLSGLLNRRGFEQRAGRILTRARRRRTPAALLLIDIDHFKVVNDTFGHAVGDRTILSFASMLLRVAPKSALVARLGGEEFAVLLDRATLEMARHQAEAIRLATLGHGEPAIPPLTVSVGVARVREGSTLQGAIERADALLYEAKHGGRNTVRCEADALAPRNMFQMRRKREP